MDFSLRSLSLGVPASLLLGESPARGSQDRALLWKAVNEAAVFGGTSPELGLLPPRAVLTGTVAQKGTVVLALRMSPLPGLRGQPTRRDTRVLL